jgi:CYTH domain-containing protein
VKYARVERERRFVLEALPSGVFDARRIDDLYIAGTTLRLRRVTPADGGEVVHKLGQKVRPDAGDPSIVHHTTMYLTVDEYEVLSVLAGDRLSKTRWSWNIGDRVWSVDEHDGLVLAEAEVDAGERLDPPPGSVLDVSLDDRYSGAHLAARSP